jgi:hypothetical protein
MKKPHSAAITPQQIEAGMRRAHELRSEAFYRLLKTLRRALTRPGKRATMVSSTTASAR